MKTNVRSRERNAVQLCNQINYTEVELSRKLIDNSIPFTTAKSPIWNLQTARKVTEVFAISLIEPEYLHQTSGR